MKKTTLILGLLVLFSWQVKAEEKPAAPETGVKGWPVEAKEIEYKSSADDTMQPAMFYAAAGDNPVPLLVVLHTWSGDYKQTSGVGCAKWCIKNNWAMIHPDFRGSNTRPEAMGSELVVKDILSAVEYAKQQAKIDSKRIYLIGWSGGGYASLLMAGRAPEIWAGVSAWVPISDLKAWHAECTERNSGYAKNMEAACGGKPGDSDKVDAEYETRSAKTYLANAKNVPAYIAAGIHDGHTGSVPISQSFRAFNILAGEKDRVSQEDIDYFTKEEKVPQSLQAEIQDPDFGNKKPLFRRVSDNVSLTIFEGSHEIVLPAALSWLAKQKKD
jgi:dipeptidyl aminopeptidase/acylaminoacyl peptidase